jgi:glycine betaine/choline ABC-type transport system substrate-binding protein
MMTGGLAMAAPGKHPQRATAMTEDAAKPWRIRTVSDLFFMSNALLHDGEEKEFG